MNKRKTGFAKPEEQMDVPEFVMNLVDRLWNAGFDAYIVGGAVRDMLLRRPILDWDIATSASPREIQSLFHDIPRFKLKHETVTLVHAGLLYEITTMKGNDRPGTHILEDLKHRDFTINAMAYDVGEKAVLDPCGGRMDLLKRRVKAVGDPVDRFREDPLRLIRAVRIANDLDFSIDRGTLSFIYELSGELQDTAQERIRDEIMKILLSARPSNGFNLLRKTGLLNHIIPELLEGYLKRQEHGHRYTIYRHIMQTVDHVEPDEVLRLTALFHDIAKPRVRKKIENKFRFFGHAEESARLAQEIMVRLRFGNDWIKKVRHLIQNHMIVYTPNWGDGAVRRLLARVGAENMELLLAFRKADIRAHGATGFTAREMNRIQELEKRVGRMMDRSPALKTRDLAVGGREVMDILELSGGPEVGAALDRLMETVIERPELNTKKALTALLEQMKGNGLENKYGQDR